MEKSSTLYGDLDVHKDSIDWQWPTHHATPRCASWGLSLVRAGRAEHLFALKQALGAFDFVGMLLAECDAEIEQQMQTLKLYDGEPAKGKERGRARNAPKFDLRTQLFQMCGVGLTRIDGWT